jgi:short-subunit dehydrogenase
MNIIITGASSGIGYETTIQIAKKLSNTGTHTLVILARRLQNLIELKNYIEKEHTNISVIAETFDIGKDDFSKIIKKHKLNRIDALLNNAAILIKKPFEEFTHQEIFEIFNINVFGLIKLTQSSINILNKGSHILNISSMAGFQGSQKISGLSIYSASKGAITILTESLAEELKEKEISVNGLALGSVQTEMLEKAYSNLITGLNPEKISNFISDFLLNGHRFTNGKVLPISITIP